MINETLSKRICSEEMFQVVVIKDWFDEIFNFNVQSDPI